MIFRPKSRSRPAAAAVELAIVLPFLMLVVLGCVDFGRFLYYYIALNNASRSGAAYASMNPYVGDDLLTWKAAIQEVARDEMVNQTGYTRSLLTTETESVLDGPGLHRFQVTASYPFQTIVNWPGIPHKMSLQAKTEIRAIR